MFLGLVLNLVSNLASKMRYAKYIRIYPGVSVENLFIFLIIIGAGCFILGTFNLLIVATLGGLLAYHKGVCSYLFEALGLPLMFMYPIFNSRRYTPTTMPFGLFYENNVTDYLTYGLGAMWLLFDARLVTRHHVLMPENNGKSP